MENQEKPQKSPVAEREEQILAFWKEKQIFQKTLDKEAPKGNFVFYDGPPFATGSPHYGHILAGTMKDVIPRYKTMQGYHVPRKWGWDCHGLPIENLIEKELNLKTKKDIEDLGIEKFNKAARDIVFRYADEWKQVIPRMGRFVDMENDYRTMDTSYTESVWWSFKTIADKGFVYEGFKSMQICPRCETTLSNFEVNQGYKDITDISVYVNFESIEEKGTYFLAWTTTPWTLPGNVALAINPDITYVKITLKDSAKQGKFILAKDRLAVIKEEYEIVEEFAGSTLVGKSYAPVFNYYENADLKNRENGWKVYAAGFVTTEDGTGIVHIAPAFGADDLLLAQDNKLPFIQHVAFNGTFKPEVTDFAGQQVKPKDDHQKADIEVIKWLAHNGKLFAKEKLVHSYPHCWRCDTPLLNYATSSWFVEVTKMKDQLVAENKKVSWVPDSIGEGRFGKWLENARDWAVSRARYWGAPIPVWKCKECEEKKFIGSIAELKAALPKRNKYLVMRHGESQSNINDVISSVYSNEDHLTEKGKQQVQDAANKLKGTTIDYIVGSDFFRTKETLQTVATTLGIGEDKITLDARLRELNAGVFEGKRWPEFHEHFASYEERFTKIVPEGENYTDVKRRMLEALYDIDAKFEGKTILIVSHGLSIEMLFAGVDAFSKSQSVQERKDKKFLFNNAEVRELDFRALPHNELFDIDVHRPFIDGVTFACACGGEMKRIPEVFDTWYDSGSMPYAQNHYPFENKETFEQSNSPLFPADFIAEGQDQTRGWFYSLLVLNSALFGTSPYKNVIVNGIVLAEDGQKMSKRLKNYPDPLPTVEKYSADALRYFLMASPVVRAEDVAFSEKGVDEIQKKILNRLNNVVTFYEMYATEKKDFKGSSNVLDRWMIARLNETREQMTSALDNYELDRAARPIVDFVDDLSTWYVRRSRDRFKGEDAADREAALATTRFVLMEFSKLIAPFMPFIADDIYLKLRADSDKESVHLENWPQTSVTEKAVIAVKSWFGKNDAEIITEMQEVRNLVTLGLEARAAANIKVRQPLATLKVKASSIKDKELFALIEDEVNVKEIVVDGALEKEVALDTTITPELKAEGDMRELVRAIQDLRKKSNLNPGQEITLVVDTDEAGKKLIAQFEADIKKVTSVASFEYAAIEAPKMKVGDTSFGISIK